MPEDQKPESQAHRVAHDMGVAASVAFEQDRLRRAGHSEQEIEEILPAIRERAKQQQPLSVEQRMRVAFGVGRELDRLRKLGRSEQEMAIEEASIRQRLEQDVLGAPGAPAQTSSPSRIEDNVPRTSSAAPIGHQPQPTQPPPDYKPTRK